jgi:4-diphosphocytidyl-2-C-methyl-D-erythritol kinase
MHLKRNQDGVHVLAPAKINLHLEILQKRSDGYHEIETIMHAVSLYDTLQVFKRDDGNVTLELHTPVERANEGSAMNLDPHQIDPAWLIPADSTNLVVRGLKKLQELLGVRAGAHVSLTKAIPAAAGLGGGSSDTAAALTAASLVWLGRFDRQAVEAVASQIGSDLSFFLGSSTSEESGLALCRGRGEQVTPLALTGRLHGVIAHPPAGCSTADVYRKCRVPELPRSPEKLIRALAEGKFDELPHGVFNRLEEAASHVTPWVGQLRDWMEESSAWSHLLSGSGSARFALCRNETEAAQLARHLQACGLPRVHVWQSCMTPAIEAQTRLGIASQ